MISSGFMGILPVILVIVLYFSGMPVAFALLSAGLFYFGVVNTSSPVELIFQKFITSAQSFPLLAVPFFVMAGSMQMPTLQWNARCSSPKWRSADIPRASRLP